MDARTKALGDFKSLVRRCHTEVMASKNSPKFYEEALAKSIEISAAGAVLGEDFGYDIGFLTRVMHEECDKAMGEK